MKFLKGRYLKTLAGIGIMAVMLLAYQNCADYELASTVSQEEGLTISTPPFVPSVGGTSDAEDSYQASFPLASSVNNEFVQRCTKERYDQERAEAIQLVTNDTTNTLIPVRFSISAGDPHDEVSALAYRRSILRVDDDGETDVYVSPRSVRYYRTSQPQTFRYVADHTEARERYIKGKKCFFDVIKVKSSHKTELTLDGSYNHSWAILNAGYVYPENDPDDKYELSPRLFQKIEEQTGVPQVIPLYVADVRDFIAGVSIFNKQFVPAPIRSKEYVVQLRQLFYLDRLFVNRDKFIANMSKAQTISGRYYSGYEGMSQFFDNLIFGYNATVLNMQYTPIVIDLGAPHIRTSSLDWGSFFNLAGLAVPNNDRGYKRISHQVAWVGGDLKQVNENGKMVWKRVADDGFLVLPDANNEIHTSEQLLSNKTVVDGRRYANGFEALAAMANKNCASEEMKEKYVGPWDEAYNTLKIWVDANRNGVVDSGELNSLRHHGIVALNPCSKNHETAVDQYGNRTRIRSSVLIANDLAAGSGEINETEVRERLFSGKTSSNDSADFRVMIDIYFKSKPSFFLENLDTSLGGTY